jgi:WS/DGAT/MGAT family acyltransferase
MAGYWYDRLTALDSSFLLLEKPHAPLHVASTLTFEAEPLRTPEGGINAQLIRDNIAAEIHRIPRYRQKIQWVPMSMRPVWVDDDHFRLDYHVRHTSLPRPGTAEQLRRLSARIMEQPLDLTRPLWETWIVEGLEGDRFALISKVHHCMIDGVSGAELLKILLSPSPEASEPKPARFFPRRAPSGAQLLRDESLRRLSLPLEALRDVGGFFREAQDRRREVLSHFRAAADLVGATMQMATPTPINHAVSPHRRFDWWTMDFSEIREVRRGLGGSVNDVVLATVCGAVQRFLEHRQVSPNTVDFRVMAPVSVRRSEDQEALGNQVSAWLIDLPIADLDPREQLRQIQVQTTELKHSGQAVGATILADAAEWGSSTLLALGARNISRVLPCNLVVTNVPGPQFPLYMLGAKMIETIPLVPLVDNLGLGIALMSYNGKLCWGFNGDYDLVPDLEIFKSFVCEAFAALKAAAGTDSIRSPEEPDAPLQIVPHPAQ